MFREDPKLTMKKLAGVPLLEPPYGYGSRWEGVKHSVVAEEVLAALERAKWSRDHVGMALSPNKLDFDLFVEVRGSKNRTNGLYVPCFGVATTNATTRTRRYYVGGRTPDGKAFVARSFLRERCESIDEEVKLAVDKADGILRKLHEFVDEMRETKLTLGQASGFMLKMARRRERKWRLPYQHFGHADQALMDVYRQGGKLTMWDTLLAYSVGVLKTNPVDYQMDKLVAGKKVLTKSPVEK